MKQPSNRPPWIQRILSLWNTDNIKVVRRIIVSVIGVTVLLIGIALLVLPGPAFVVIPLGLAILATEYAWARRWLKRVRQIASDVVSGGDARRPEILVFSFARSRAFRRQGQSRD